MTEKKGSFSKKKGPALFSKNFHFREGKGSTDRGRASRKPLSTGKPGPDV